MLVMVQAAYHLLQRGAVLGADEVLQQLALPAPQVHHAPHPTLLQHPCQQSHTCTQTVCGEGWEENSQGSTVYYYYVEVAASAMLVTYTAPWHTNNASKACQCLQHGCNAVSAASNARLCVAGYVCNQECWNL